MGAGIPRVDDVGAGDERFDVPLRLRFVPSECRQKGVVGINGDVDGHADVAGDATRGVSGRTFEFRIDFTPIDRLAFEWRPFDQTLGEAGGVIDDGRSITLGIAGSQDPAIAFRRDPAVHAGGGVGDEYLGIWVAHDVSRPDRGRFGPDWPSDTASSDDHGFGICVEDVLTLELQIDIPEEPEGDSFQRARCSVFHRGQFTEVDGESLALDEKRITMRDPCEWPERFLLWSGIRLDPRDGGRGNHQDGGEGRGDSLVDLHGKPSLWMSD